MARCKWWRVSAAGLRLHVVGRERERRGSRAARVEEEVWGVVCPSPLYIEGWAPALTPPPSPRPAAKEGGVGGKFPPPF